MTLPTQQQRSNWRSCLYPGLVMHRRLQPFGHKFRYRITTFLFDVDELPALDRATALFGYNKTNVFSFQDRDHGPRDGSPLRPWAARQLARAGIIGTDEAYRGRISILCLPRVFGYVFNPLSVWLCHDDDDRLIAIIYEVRNTFGGQHAYTCRVDDRRQSGNWIEQSASKQFYVSPFLPENMFYRFRLRAPDDDLSFLIREYGPEGKTLIATWTGKREAFSGQALALLALRFPFLTLKVIAAIHWQAFLLWRKGARFYSQEAGPEPRSEVNMPGRS